VTNELSCFLVIERTGDLMTRSFVFEVDVSWVLDVNTSSSAGRLFLEALLGG